MTEAAIEKRVRDLREAKALSRQSDALLARIERLRVADPTLGGRCLEQLAALVKR
jgi:hypothetical protein